MRLISYDEIPIFSTKVEVILDGNSVAFRAFYFFYECGGNPEAQYF